MTYSEDNHGRYSPLNAKEEHLLRWRVRLLFIFFMSSALYLLNLCMSGSKSFRFALFFISYAVLAAELYCFKVQARNDRIVFLNKKEIDEIDRDGSYDGKRRKEMIENEKKRSIPKHSIFLALLLLLCHLWY